MKTTEREKLSSIVPLDRTKHRTYMKNLECGKMCLELKEKFNVIWDSAQHTVLALHVRP